MVYLTPITVFLRYNMSEELGNYTLVFYKSTVCQMIRGEKVKYKIKFCSIIVLKIEYFKLNICMCFKRPSLLIWLADLFQSVQDLFPARSVVWTNTIYNSKNCLQSFASIRSNSFQLNQTVGQRERNKFINVYCTIVHCISNMKSVRYWWRKPEIIKG